MNTNQLQQGDVLLLSVTKLPAKCKTLNLDARGVVLAEGEHTGHFHGIANEGGLALLEAPDGKRYLNNATDKPVSVTHQEHKPVTIPPGLWQIGGVREKDWFTEMVRPVID
jgi:hypothetical protein